MIKLHLKTRLFPALAVAGLALSAGSAWGQDATPNCYGPSDVGPTLSSQRFGFNACIAEPEADADPDSILVTWVNYAPDHSDEARYLFADGDVDMWGECPTTAATAEADADQASNIAAARMGLTENIMEQFCGTHVWFSIGWRNQEGDGDRACFFQEGMPAGTEIKPGEDRTAASAIQPEAIMVGADFLMAGQVDVTLTPVYVRDSDFDGVVDEGTPGTVDATGDALNDCALAEGSATFKRFPYTRPLATPIDDDSNFGPGVPTERPPASVQISDPAPARFALSITPTGGFIYAEEVFGPGSEERRFSYPPDEDDPTVELELVGNGLTPGVDGSITYSLTGGATFASSLGRRDLVVAPPDGSSLVPDISRVTVSDGRAGQSSVTYELEVGSEGVPRGSTFILTLPDLVGLVDEEDDRDATEQAPITRVSVTSARVRGGVTSPLGDFPAGAGSVAPASVVLVADPVRALSLTVTAPETTTRDISLDDPTQFTPLAPPLGTDTADLASVSGVLADPIPLASSGAPFVADNDDSRAQISHVVIEVSGNVRDGDAIVFAGRGASQTGPNRDRVAIVRGGSAELRVPIEAVLEVEDADPSDAFAGEAGLDHPIRLQVGGARMRFGDVDTSVRLDFTDPRNLDRVILAETATTTTLQFAGEPRRAYAIAPGTAQDASHVRVKCEDSSSCRVFFVCDGQDGEEFYAEDSDLIDGRSTRQYSDADLEALLGSDWRGRLSCQVSSFATISVQVLTQSPDGTLVNNTFVNDE